MQRGLDGSPCMTSCRIIFRGNQKDMEDIYTPDDVQCATGTNPRVCILKNYDFFCFLFLYTNIMMISIIK